MAIKEVEYIRYEVFLESGSCVTIKAHPLSKAEEVGSYTQFYDMEENKVLSYRTSNIHHFKEGKVYKQDPEERDADYQPTTRESIEDLMSTYDLLIESEGDVHKIYRRGYSGRVEITGDDYVVLGWLNGYDPEDPWG